MAKIHISQRFGSTPNKLLYNPLISLKAKGLYGYIQAKPDDWNFSAQRICLECKEAIDSIRLALQELEEFGYLVRKKYQNQKGHWEIDYCLLSEPELKNPALENPTLENPASENTPNNTKKDLQNNINNNKSVSETKVSTTKPDEKKEVQQSLFPETELVNPENRTSKKVAQKKVKKPIEPDNEVKRLFRNSDVYKMVKFDDNKNGDYSEFENRFNTPEFAPIDLVYYFHVVSDWSDLKNEKRTKNGWIATIRTFIRGDAEKNKVKLKPEFQPNKNDDNQAMLDILNSRE